MCSWLLPWVKEEKAPEGQWAGLSLTVITCGLIGPVPTVVLPITLLALRDALPIATLEGLSWTTWKAQSTQQGLETPAESAAGTQAVPQKHSLHSSSSLLSPQSFTLSQTQKRGLQNLFLHVNW